MRSLVRREKPKTISKQIFRINTLRKELIGQMLCDLNTECLELFKTTQPSVLRGKDKEDFKVEDVCTEMKERPPLLYNVIQIILQKKYFFSWPF